MDPLSITASVIAVIGLADKIISLCKVYVATLKDAPSDLRTIMVEAGSLKSVVTNLEFFLATWGTGNMLSIVKSLEGPEGPLEASRKALVALEKLFPSAADHNATRAKLKATTISYAKLAWPFKEEKARKILHDIARYKASISLALTTDTANDTKNIKANIERLCDAQDLETRKEVLKWLVTTDPSPNHNTACALHDSHTGTWITRSDEYQQWKNGSSRVFWLHGIPGAGKTILFSHIVEDIKQYCKTFGSKDITCSYYYCYFGRAQDEVPHLLRWVINQLCRESQYIPKEILDSFRTGEQPSVPVLVQALSAVLLSFRYVYVMLDALDETLERQNLLRLLNQLAGVSFEKLGLLVTSRKIIDIETSLTPISTCMSLSNPYVDEDVRIYIQNQLQGHHKLRTWPKSLLDEISVALVKGAKGMFRWATCQIDILGRLHNVCDIRKALHELPETLDETYERILMKIPQKSSRLAHKVLQLLAFNNEYTFSSLDELAEAVVVDVEQLSFSPEKRLLDEHYLFEICTCLITLTSSEQVRLAHYSVKEYLVSDRIQRGPTTSFQISRMGFDVMYTKICLVYLLDITYDSSCSAKDFLNFTEAQRSDVWDQLDLAFPFFTAAHNWELRDIGHISDPAIHDLLIRLFNPKGVHYQQWLYFSNIMSENNGVPGYPSWKTLPGAEPTIAFANACALNLVGTAKVMLESKPDLVTSGDLLEFGPDPGCRYGGILEAGTLLDVLDVAIYFVDCEIVDLLLDWGANPNANRPDQCCKLLFALKTMFFREKNCYESESDILDIVQSLLNRGADPNPHGVAITPLQAAALGNNYYFMKLLLDAGADVNAVGDDEAIVRAIERRSTRKEDPVLCRLHFGSFGDIGQGYLGQYEIQQSIHARSSLRNYETPLRILETRINEDRWERDELLAMKNILTEKGGQSAHLYPVDGNLWDWILAIDPRLPPVDFPTPCEPEPSFSASYIGDHTGELTNSGYELHDFR